MSHAKFAHPLLILINFNLERHHRGSNTQSISYTPYMSCTFQIFSVIYLFSRFYFMKFVYRRYATSEIIGQLLKTENETFTYFVFHNQFQVCSKNLMRVSFNVFTSFQLLDDSCKHKKKQAQFAYIITLSFGAKM